ncbi:hypothetical protein [Arcobacter sp.]|uniref:hypothetical protein n=1 Tax=unclassified Arcobacter TaxID=2593671 RepID=UPI003AFFC5E2
MIYEGYVLNSELHKKAGVSHCAISQLTSVTKDKLGKLVIIKKGTLPEKYQSAAEKCTDLGKYTLMAEFNRELGMCPHYLSVFEINHNLEFKGVKILDTRLIELPERIIELFKEGKTLFKITSDNEEYADEVIDMQGLKIGFY